RLGHDGPLGVARRSRRNGRPASDRGAWVSRRAFFLFLTAALSRNRLGRHRELAAGPAAIQGALSGLVRSARFRVLFPALLQQTGRAELGRARVCQLWDPGRSLLAGTSRFETSR